MPSPVGGVKVVLEYANKMVDDGHDVNIIYPTKIKMDELLQPSLLSRITMAKKLITKKLKNQHTATSWFQLNPAVNEMLVPSLLQKHIPGADITFGTSRQTAEWLNTYPKDKGKKMYLIQHFEDWLGTSKEVEDTWKMPFHKIVISRWLQERATQLGEQSSLVNNGLDFKSFGITTPIEKRNPHSLIMLYHHFTWKGSAEGLAAVHLVKKIFPALTLTLFGVEPKPKGLPPWIVYHQKPPQLKMLYNDAAIFLSPSWGEGWALPPAEAMQCGCAAIITDIGGHRDYGVDGQDLLLAPVKDSIGFSNTIISLLQDNERRIAIARSGNEAIQKFTWDTAYQKLKSHIQVS